VPPVYLPYCTGLITVRGLRPDMALAWLRAHPAVTAPIISPSQPGQWQAVREALNQDLSQEDFARVGAIFN
jgi:aryl-alcohol dehydrogenase-like predicted oxidoreductase